MGNKSCIHQYIGSLWCIEPQWFSEAVEAVKSGLIQPTAQAEDPREDQPLYTVDNSGLAVLEISGQMQKGRAKFGGTSTVELRRALRAAARDQAIEGILLVIDSPGGTVSGTDELATDITAAAQQKLLWAHVEDLGASAAYWVGSQADRLSAAPAAEVGSIGTFAVLHDLTGAAKMEGIQVHVVSTGAFKGAGVPGTPITEELLGEVRQRIEALNDHFVRAVALGRRVTQDRVRSEWSDGRVWIAGKALKMGMIDAVERLDTVVGEMREKMARQRKAKGSARELRAATLEQERLAMDLDLRAGE